MRAAAALLTVEVIAVTACVVAPLPAGAVLVGLFVIASASLYLRQKSWADRLASSRLYWVTGVLAGAAALGLALLVIGPALEARGAMVGWSEHGAVRGKPSVLIAFGIIVAASAAANEAIWRGWLLERVRDLAAPGPRRDAIAISISVAIEGVAVALVAGTVWSGLGAAVFGVAAGALYLAGGRSLVAPMAARVTFELGLLVLEALRMVD